MAAIEEEIPPPPLYNLPANWKFIYSSQERRFLVQKNEEKPINKLPKGTTAFNPFNPSEIVPETEVHKSSFQNPLEYIQGKKYAVIIRLHYAHPDEIPNNRFTDDEELQKKLTERGFTVTLYTDYGAGLVATKAAILKTITDLNNSLFRNDIFIIYFSGHGCNVRREAPSDDNYDEAWCLGGSNYIYDKELYAATSTNGTETSFGRAHKIVFSDTCYGGGMSRGLDEGVRGFLRNEDGVSSQPAHIVLYAAADCYHIAHSNYMYTTKWSSLYNKKDIKTKKAWDVLNGAADYPLHSFLIGNLQDPDWNPTHLEFYHDLTEYTWETLNGGLDLPFEDIVCEDAPFNLPPGDRDNFEKTSRTFLITIRSKADVRDSPDVVTLKKVHNTLVDSKFANMSDIIKAYGKAYATKELRSTNVAAANQYMKGATDLLKTDPLRGPSMPILYHVCQLIYVCDYYANTPNKRLRSVESFLKNYPVFDPIGIVVKSQPVVNIKKQLKKNYMFSPLPLDKTATPQLRGLEQNSIRLSGILREHGKDQNYIDRAKCIIGEYIPAELNNAPIGLRNMIRISGI